MTRAQKLLRAEQKTFNLRLAVRAVEADPGPEAAKYLAEYRVALAQAEAEYERLATGS